MSTIPTDYVALTDYLTEHLETEQGALDAYERLIEDRPEDAISYLIRTILKDEARHHELFADILNSLESIVRWEDITPRVPAIGSEIEDRDELLATTEKLLELERDDLKELKRLRKAWAKAGGEFGLWAVLVESAELDTEKHIRMLKYLRRLIADAEPAS
jgi:bacterioferritin (cytochrome b1)